MVNGTDKSDLVAKGFWGGFVKSFKKSAARKKRSNDSTAASPVGVEIDTVLLMSDKTNSTDTPKIETALTNAPGLDFEAGSIKSKMSIIYKYIVSNICIRIYRSTIATYILSISYQLQLHAIQQIYLHWFLQPHHIWKQHFLGLQHSLNRVNIYILHAKGHPPANTENTKKLVCC